MNELLKSYRKEAPWPIFGVPTGHEETARQAYNAALDDVDRLIDELSVCNDAAHAFADRIDELNEVIEGLVRQFAYWSDSIGGYHAGGLSALEDAFDALDWDDPQPAPKSRCDEPDCMVQATYGWHTADGGYRRTCFDHELELSKYLITKVDAG